MSVHSEIQNVKRNRSGDASLDIHKRTGESGEGNSYFDMRVSGSISPEEALFNKGQEAARIYFLKRYFAILKSVLTPEEFKFIKLKFQTKKPDKLVASWCGVSQRRLFARMREKLEEKQEQIEELIDESGWDNAELFVKTVLSSAQELSFDGNTLVLDPHDPQHDFDELQRARELFEMRKEIYSVRYQCHKDYVLGYSRGSVKWQERIDRVVDMSLHTFAFLEHILVAEEYASDPIFYLRKTLQGMSAIFETLHSSAKVAQRQGSPSAVVVEG